jgi:putative hemolysin
MVWTSTMLALGGIAVFAGASFFFALAESALFSLGQWRAKRLAEQNPITGAQVVRLLSEPQDLLAAIVLGNTVANAAMVAIGMWMALSAHGWPLLLTVAVLFVLVLAGCEVVPKTLAVRMPDQWALRVAPVMIWLMRLTGWLRKFSQLVNGLLLRTTVTKTIKPQPQLTDEEYHELLELAYQQGTLAKSEKEIILQIISLDRRTAKDVMRPRSSMACVSDDATVDEMIAASRKFKHRRLPIYDETPDTIVGVLNTRALLLDPQIDLADAIEFPSFVPESMNLLHLLKSLQRQHRGLAIVLDEFGGTAGVVTMEDILESVVGEIRAEVESEGFVMEKLREGRWRVNGTMRLDDFRREYPELGDVPSVETMGGLLVTQMEVVPAAGQSVVFCGLRLTAQVVDERRVRELLVESIALSRGRAS